MQNKTFGRIYHLRQSMTQHHVYMGSTAISVRIIVKFFVIITPITSFVNAKVIIDFFANRLYSPTALNRQRLRFQNEPLANVQILRHFAYPYQSVIKKQDNWQKGKKVYIIYRYLAFFIASDNC